MPLIYSNFISQTMKRIRTRNEEYFRENDFQMALNSVALIHFEAIISWYILIPGMFVNGDSKNKNNNNIVHREWENYYETVHKRPDQVEGWFSCGHEWSS